MYYDKFLPFYMTYADSSLYSRERIQEQEFALMKSYYPETARKIQEKVEEECQLMDYEGSRLYDEHPDKFMMHRLYRHVPVSEETVFRPPGKWQRRRFLMNFWMN